MLLEFDGTFIFALISFIIFVSLMNLILYRPIMKVISEREKLLEDNRDIVQKSNKKADEAKEFHACEISNARLEASKLLSDTQKGLLDEKNAKINAKKEEVLNKVNENSSILLNEKDEAKNILKDEIENYVKMAVSKVLGEENPDIKIDKERLSFLMEGKR